MRVRAPRPRGERDAGLVSTFADVHAFVTFVQGFLRRESAP